MISYAMQLKQHAIYYSHYNIVPFTLYTTMIAPSQLDLQYKRICKIGSGSYGTVYLFERRKDAKPSFIQIFFMKQKTIESNYVAVKLYKKPSNNRQGIDFSCLRQINCLQGLNHKNIIYCHQIFYEPRAESVVQGIAQINQVFVVMDYHLELSDLLKVHNSWQDKRRIAKQIARGLKYLHDNYIFHRDMKPDNIFVSKSGWVRIGDFGFAKEFGTPYKKYTINACTIEYRAPQVFLGTHYYTQMSDIWSLGCIFAYIFTGKHVFNAQNKSEIELLSQIFYLAGTPDEINWPRSSFMPIQFKCVHEKKKSFEDQLKLPSSIATLIEECMNIDPKKRLNTSQILNHPFFQHVSDEPFSVNVLWEAKIKKILGKQ